MKNQTVLGAALAGLLAIPALAEETKAPAADGKHGDQPHCWGVNKCKGAGACGGAGHSCAGENGCKGMGWLPIDKDVCLKVNGGSLTPVEKTGGKKGKAG